VTDLGKAMGALALDFASTIFFLILYALTGNIVLAVSLGIALAAGQIGWRLLKRERVDAVQWVSALLVLMSGTATLITRDPTFVMLKPTVIYIAVGCAMLQKGWLRRYMPQRALDWVPDLIIKSGYVWAGLMFFSAALNLVLAFNTNLLIWGSVMSAWGLASKVLMIALQFTYMRFIGRRRARAARLVAATA
jgi:intracellular septation protein A